MASGSSASEATIFGSDVTADAKALLAALRAEQRGEARYSVGDKRYPPVPTGATSSGFVDAVLQARSGNQTLNQKALRPSQVPGNELEELRKRVAHMEEVLSVDRGKRRPALQSLSTLVCEAEADGKEAHHDHQQPLRPQEAEPQGQQDEVCRRVSGGGGTGGSCERCSDLALLKQELSSCEKRHAAAEEELAASAAAHKQQIDNFEANSAERGSQVEEFARACAEALIKAGATEAKVAQDAEEAMARCKQEAAEAAAEVGRRSFDVQQQLEQQQERTALLALQEQHAAQVMDSTRWQHEAARLREWNSAYEATAKAEALTAHRYRSELTTALQELQRHRQWQQQVIEQARAGAAVHRLEPIPESSRESSAGSCSPGREEALTAEEQVAEPLPAEGQAELAEEGTEAQKAEELQTVAENAEMKDLVIRLRDELAQAQAETQEMAAQRDEVQESLAELRQEHSVVLLAFRKGVRLLVTHNLFLRRFLHRIQ